jgi:hypothetical protein
MMRRGLLLPTFLTISIACSPSGSDPEDSDSAGGTDSADDDDDDGDSDPDDEDDSASTDPEDDDNSESGESGESGSDSTGEEPQGIPVLGSLAHTLDAVEFSVIASGDMTRPSDLEFNPEVDGELWVTNLDDDSITIIENANRDGQTQSNRWSANGSAHFLARPSGIAFGTPGVMATSQQTDLITQPSTPADFMGPTLWGADSSFYEGGHNSHLDMLHNSPNSSGIAWEQGNVYWVYDGYHGSLTRYDFHSDHGLGGTDHTDGEVYRLAAEELGYEANVASHVAYHAPSNMVYAADTANNRIFVLDATTGEVGGDIAPNYDGGIQRGVNGAEFATMINGGDVELPMVKPSGLEIHDDYLFVTDYATSVIYGFSLQGELIDWLETEIPAESLMGITFDTDGSLFGVNAAAGEVYRVAAIE